MYPKKENQYNSMNAEPQLSVEISRLNILFYAASIVTPVTFIKVFC